MPDMLLSPQCVKAFNCWCKSLCACPSRGPRFERYRSTSPCHRGRRVDERVKVISRFTRRREGPVCCQSTTLALCLAGTDCVVIYDDLPRSVPPSFPPRIRANCFVIVDFGAPDERDSSWDDARPQERNRLMSLNLISPSNRNAHAATRYRVKTSSPTSPYSPLRPHHGEHSFSRLFRAGPG